MASSTTVISCTDGSRVAPSRCTTASRHTLSSALVLASYGQLAWLLVPFSLAVALSRVVLGLHYPSDVIVGAFIGATTAAVSFNLL